MRLAAMVCLALPALAACGVREPVPAYRTNDARFGRLGGSGPAPTRDAMCRHWIDAIVGRDPSAITHVSFPEADAQSACFTPVAYKGDHVRVGAAPLGCAFPEAATRARLEALADEMDALAADRTTSNKLFPCTMAPVQRAAASRHNARTLRALARSAETFPYAAVVVPGHGWAEQDDMALSSFVPGEACRPLADGDLRRLGAMPIRTARAADALRGGVAPVAIVSGGAVHSRLVEAFAMMHLLQCREHIAAERILVEPCAQHTHTNLRNGGRWLRAMGARAAYLVTDDGIQSDYFQDTSGFELILGSIDQRSLRDWGYVIGSWRQVSAPMKSGFWFTPYRFWAEPRGGLGSATCVDEP